MRGGDPGEQLAHAREPAGAGDEQVGQLVVIDAQDTGKLTYLDVDILPLQLWHGGVPVDKFAVVNGLHSAVHRCIEQDDDGKESGG